MFMFGSKKKVPDQADLAMKQISDLLFPPFKTEEIDGEKYAIDSSVDTNIDAVIADLKDGYLDEHCINNLKAVFDKLYKVRELIKVFHEMDPSVSKYIITMGPTVSIADSIQAADDDVL